MAVNRRKILERFLLGFSEDFYKFAIAIKQDTQALRYATAIAVPIILVTLYVFHGVYYHERHFL